MASWKRLTQPSGGPVDVNMDQVLCMKRYTDRNITLLFSVGDQTGEALEVKETLDEIHMTQPLQSFGL